MAIKRFTLEAVFSMVDKVTAPISRLQNRIQKFTRSVHRGLTRVNRSINKMGAGIKRMSVAGVAGLTALGFALGNVIGVGADFGRAIGSAAAKFPAVMKNGILTPIKRGSDEFKALAAEARKVGASTEFSAIEAAQGLNFLAKAGFSATDAIKSLAPIVDFATASEIGLAEAADIASDAIGAFGLDDPDPDKKLAGLQRIMDVMSKTANSTNTSVAELFESMKKGGPVADTAGASVETFSAMMGFLASNGIKAAQAGTASKNVTLALAGVGNKAAKTFDKLRIKLADSTGGMRDQLDVLDDLRKALSKKGEQEQIEIIAAIFGKIPIAAAAKLVGNTGKKIRELRIELEKAGGSSKRTAAFIRNDVKGSLDSLGSAIQDVKIGIFELNEGPLKDGIDKMTEWTRTHGAAIGSGIGEFLLMMIDNFQTIALWTKRVAIVVAVFFAISMAIKAALVTLTLFNFAVTVFGLLAKTIAVVSKAIAFMNVVMFANPIGLIVLAVVALIAGFTALVVWIDEISAGFDKLPVAIQVILGPIGLLIKAIKFIKDNSDFIFEIAGDGIDKITDAANFVGDKIGGAFDNVFGDETGVDVNGDSVEPSLLASVASPQERVARSIEETTNTNKSEILVRTEGGTAEIVKNGMGGSLTIQPSGGI